MKKIVIILAIFLIVGCTKKIDKFYLNDKYYNEGNYIKVDANKLDTIKNDSMVIYTYNNSKV